MTEIKVCNSDAKKEEFLSFFYYCLGNESILIDFKKDGKPPGFLPDGMTIDEESQVIIH